MTQIQYNYPAMLAHVGAMNGFAATLQTIGSDIGAEQGALKAGWQGGTGETYQAWQTQWNQAQEELVTSYRAMAQTHEQNTMTMQARDSGEAAKWA